MPKLIAENPPEPPPRKSKYAQLLAAACKEPNTWFRIDQEYKNMTSVIYLRDKYPHTPESIEKNLKLEYKGVTYNDKVYIYVCAKTID